jgi:hypothetical protein
MEIIDWFVPNMSPVSWNRLLMLSAKNEGGDEGRGTPRQSLSIRLSFILTISILPLIYPYFLDHSRLTFPLCFYESRSSSSSDARMKQAIQ